MILKECFQHPQDVVKDSNVPPGDNKNTTNMANSVFKKIAKMVTYIVGAFGYNGNNVGAFSEGEEHVWRPRWGPQLWTKKDEPSSGGYFTLEDPKSENLLTAVNASVFALRGMFLLLRQIVEKGLFCEFSVNQLKSKSCFFLPTSVSSKSPS